VEAYYLDHYSYLDSPIHRIPASIKLAVAVGLVFAVLLLPVHWETFHASLWVGIIIVALMSRIPLLGLLRRIWWMWIIVLLLSAGRLPQENGAYLFFSSLLRASECLVIMILLANTTRFTDLLQVLAGIGTPRVLVTTMGLMYRYLFVLTDERHRMHRARRSRTFRHTRRGEWLLRANVITHLFVRCTDRAGRIYAAMVSRGMQ